MGMGAKPLPQTNGKLACMCVHASVCVCVCDLWKGCEVGDPNLPDALALDFRPIFVCNPLPFLILSISLLSLLRTLCLTSTSNVFGRWPQKAQEGSETRRGRGAKESTGYHRGPPGHILLGPQGDNTELGSANLSGKDHTVKIVGFTGHTLCHTTLPL